MAQLYSKSPARAHPIHFSGHPGVTMLDIRPEGCFAKLPMERSAFQFMTWQLIQANVPMYGAIPHHPERAPLWEINSLVATTQR